MNYIRVSEIKLRSEAGAKIHFSFIDAPWGCQEGSQNPLSLRQLTWGKKASKSNSSIPESRGLG